MQSTNTRPRTRPALFARFAMAASALSVALLTGLTAGAEPVDHHASWAAPASSGVDVSNKLIPGESFRYSIRSRQVRQYQRPDERIDKWIVRRAMVIACEVHEPDPEIGPRVRVTFDELNCTLLTPNKAHRFTGDNPFMNTTGAAMTLAMEPIVGASITLTLDDTGEIRRIEGADKLLKEKELRKYAEHIVGDEAIDQLLGPIFRPIAQPAGEPGSEPWVNDMQLNFPEFATIDFDERWTINRRHEGRVSFRVESETTASINEKWPIAVLKNSRSLGSYTWNETGGRIHHTEINRFYVIELENDPDGPIIAGEEVLTISAPLGEE